MTSVFYVASLHNPRTNIARSHAQRQ